MSSFIQTKKAIYVCSFDFNLEKVVGFTRIPLGNIDSIQRGAYILSPLQEAGQDAEENYGFKLFFRRSEDDTRLTSYTVRNELPSSPSGRSLGSTPSSPAGRPAPLRPTMSQSGSSRSLSSTSGGLKPLLLSTTKPLEPIADPISYVAFKGISRDVLLRRRTPSGDRRFEESEEDDARTCKELVNSIVTRIKVQCSEAGSGWDVGEKRFVVDEDVRSLSEAERETGLLARMEYGLSAFPAFLIVCQEAKLTICCPSQNDSFGCRPTRDFILYHHLIFDDGTAFENEYCLLQRLEVRDTAFP